jgi:hypothetical protein
MHTKKTASVRYRCASLVLLALAHAAVGQAPPLPTELSSEEVIARVAPSVAVVLTGAGAGRLSGVGSAVIVGTGGSFLRRTTSSKTRERFKSGSRPAKYTTT